MKENKKKVTFADPLTTELKAPKKVIPDDSNLLIKGNMPSQSCNDFEHLHPSNHFEVDFLAPPACLPVAQNILSDATEKGSQKETAKSNANKEGNINTIPQSHEASPASPSHHYIVGHQASQGLFG